MQIDPTVQAILLLLVGAVLAHFFQKQEKKDDDTSSMSSRLAVLEATLAHVAMDQEAHKRQSEDLQQVKITVTRMGDSLRRIEAQNRAIWAHLKPVGA